MSLNETADLPAQPQPQPAAAVRSAAPETARPTPSAMVARRAADELDMYVGISEDPMFRAVSKIAWTIAPGFFLALAMVVVVAAVTS